jgi:hypothetical protein
MRFLVVRAYLRLIVFDVYLLRRKFSALHEKVQHSRIRQRPLALATTERICAAVDMACIWYWKEVLCLQRSAATACLLKQFGIAAHMVIGVQQLPFKSHAWVEVDGIVVSDKPYMRDIYAVVEIC